MPSAVSGFTMAKLLNTASNQLQSTGNVDSKLVAKIRAYNRKHGMWACMASDESRSTWQELQGLGLV